MGCRKRLFFLASLILGFSAFAEDAPNTQLVNRAPAADAVLKTQKKKTKNKKKKKKTRKKKKISRNTASESSPFFQAVIFSENYSFENMLKKSEDINREIASQSQFARVIGVRRELGLTESETAKAPQNIIINGGVQNGFEKGMILKVSRKIPVIDPYRENKQSDLEIEFATAKIVEVSQLVAVARVEKIDSIQSGVAIGTRGILIGDFVK